MNGTSWELQGSKRWCQREEAQTLRECSGIQYVSVMPIFLKGFPGSLESFGTGSAVSPVRFAGGEDHPARHIEA